MRLRSIAICALVSGICTLISCSSAPAGPEKGTPAFYWQAAKETFAAGDNMKTLEHLDKLLAEDNEYTPKALAWSLVLTSGTAAGYAELADQYEIGGRVNKSDPSAFRRPMTTYRGIAGRLSLQFAENFAKFGKIKGDTVPLAFGYPHGSAAPAPSFPKIANGIVLPQPEIESTEKRMLERGVMLAACAAAGAPDDTARTGSILKDPEAKTPRAVFALAMAQSLYNASQLYTPRKLDDPAKLAIFAERAQETLKAIPESKETKELSTKLTAALKKGKK